MIVLYMCLSSLKLVSMVIRLFDWSLYAHVVQMRYFWCTYFLASRSSGERESSLSHSLYPTDFSQSLQPALGFSNQPLQQPGHLENLNNALLILLLWDLCKDRVTEYIKNYVIVYYTRKLALVNIHVVSAFSVVLQQCQVVENLSYV